MQVCDGQLSLEGEGITGAAMLEMADKWIADNPQAWSWMMNRAAEMVSQGRRFSMEYLLQLARYEMPTNGTSQSFKVNNNTRSALRKRMVQRYPAWEANVERRQSKVDWI